MNRTHHAATLQQKRIRQHSVSSDSFRFFNLLTSPELLDQVESLLPDHRERLFPPTETLSMFLAQALSEDRSCQRAVNDVAVKRLTGGLSVCSTHTGAYCRARQRLPIEMVSTLTRYTSRLATENIPELWRWQGRSVRLVDAYYATYFLLCALQASGVDGVFEQQGARRRSTDFRLGQRLGERDHLIELAKPKIKPAWMSQTDYDQAPNAITVREVATGGKILVTTLLCSKQTPKTALKELYWSRWNIELDLRNIKTTLGMEVLSCKAPDMVLKEIWVYLLAYNMIRLLMAQAALLADILPRQISFKHTLQLWIACNRYGTLDDSHLSALFILIAQQRVGNRPHRIEPRVIKRRPKPFHLMVKPRHEAREEIRKNRHPKKLK